MFEHQTAAESVMRALLSEDIISVINREKSTFDRLVAPFGESLVLFGAGSLGRKAFAGLRGVGIKPLAFADNNPRLWNKSVDGLQVLSPQDAAQKFGGRAAFVVTIWRAGRGHRFVRTRQQLLDLNCLRIVSFTSLFWKYPETFLPHYCLDLPHKIYQETDDVRKALSLWAVDDSRREYVAQLRWRMLLDFDGLPSPVAQEQYFPNDLFSLSPDEVFVDCGAFDGDTIRSFQPDCVGISCHYSYASKEAFKVAKICKNINYDIVVVMGGLFISVFHERALIECDAIDYCLIGESEMSFPGLLLNISLKTKKLDEVDGLIYRNGNEILRNKKCNYIDYLDSLPFPARDIVDIAFYMRVSETRRLYGLGTKPALSFLTSRSCPYRCSFCNMKFSSWPSLKKENARKRCE